MYRKKDKIELDNKPQQEYNIDKLKETKGDRTMMYEGMSVEEMELAVFDLECESCEGCPFAAVCGEHELFWGCSVWEESMGEDL